MGLGYLALTYRLRPLYPYPCRHPNASLVYVPPETTRALHICIPSKCPYYDLETGPMEGCLLKPSWQAMPAKSPPSEAQRRSAREYQARMRRDHKNTSGEPLARNCWNCGHIRYLAGGFICELDDLKRIPQTAGYMQQKIACDHRLFVWRLYLDILPFTREIQRRESHAV